ncbi:hypothetical protein ANO14919_040670 [Xylariales sp. No.14919]|nr:hypothetical protein ANO14919_040670 [Xylariales sp. No.14919]
MASNIPEGVDLWMVPSAPNPNGSPPNFVNPETNENIGVVTLSVFIAIATLFVVLRLYVQLRITKHSLWWDDLALLIALPPQIAFSGIVIWMCKAGLVGRHLWDTPLAVPLLELPYWTTLIAALAQPITGLVKLAILLLYFRIFQPNRLVRWGIHFGFVIVSTTYTAWLFVFIFTSAYNDKTGSYLSWAQSAFNVATDVYIFILPISGVVKLHASTKRKVGIAGVFSTGLAAIVLSVLTLYWRVQYDGVDTDATWNATTRIVISVLEIDVGIMCACMPLFAPVFRRDGRLSKWTTYVRSLRSRFISTNPSSQRTADPESAQKNENHSFVELVPKPGAYIELAERKPSGSIHDGNIPIRKEWFDKTNTTSIDGTAQDRNSQDLTPYA